MGAGRQNQAGVGWSEPKLSDIRDSPEPNSPCETPRMRMTHQSTVGAQIGQVNIRKEEQAYARLVFLGST